MQAYGPILSIHLDTALPAPALLFPPCQVPSPLTLPASHRRRARGNKGSGPLEMQPKGGNRPSSGPCTDFLVSVLPPRLVTEATDTAASPGLSPETWSTRGHRDAATQRGQTEPARHYSRGPRKSVKIVTLEESPIIPG